MPRSPPSRCPWACAFTGRCGSTVRFRGCRFRFRLLERTVALSTCFVHLPCTFCYTSVDTVGYAAHLPAASGFGCCVQARWGIKALPLWSVTTTTTLSTETD